MKIELEYMKPTPGSCRPVPMLPRCDDVKPLPTADWLPVKLEDSLAGKPSDFYRIAAVYFLFGAQERLIYIGQTTCLIQRLRLHWLGESGGRKYIAAKWLCCPSDLLEPVETVLTYIMLPHEVAAKYRRLITPAAVEWLTEHGGRPYAQALRSLALGAK